MTNLPLLQLWQHGTKTCHITRAAEPAPYLVIVHDRRELVSQRSFDTHDAATAYAIDELRRITQPDQSQ